MTIEEAKIILLCDNLTDLVAMQAQGFISQKTLLEIIEIDLNVIKKCAAELILEKLKNQENIINDLKRKILNYENNMVINEKTIEETINNWTNKDYERLNKTITGFNIFWEGLTGYKSNINFNNIKGDNNNEISINKTN